MQRQELFKTTRGLEFPLIPRPLCDFCANPISEKWAATSGRCFFCARRCKEQASSSIPEDGALPPFNAFGQGGVRPFAFFRLAAVGLYVPDAPHKGEFGRLVSAFKYHGQGGPDLGEALDKVLAARFSDVSFHVLVPIPPEPGNARNAPLILARTLAARRDLPVVQALSLSPQYRSTKGGSWEEKFNATKGHFQVSSKQKFEGRRVALVDDIVTTGGHAHWAATALLQEGASTVNTIALARNFESEWLKAIDYSGRF